MRVLRICTVLFLRRKGNIKPYNKRNIPIKPDKVSRDLVNEKIPFQQLMVIDDKGEKLGLLRRGEALRKSEELGLDLLVVAPKANPPVAKMLDYGKFRFEKAKKEREQSRVKRIAEREPKTMSFTMMTSDHDLEFKANMVKKYLEKGLKVKLGIYLRGRQITKTELIETSMKKFLELIKEYGTVEKEATLEGKIYSCLVAPIKK